jgi:hypothetical protein
MQMYNYSSSLHKYALCAVPPRMERISMQYRRIHVRVYTTYGGPQQPLSLHLVHQLIVSSAFDHPGTALVLEGYLLGS